MGNNDNGSVVGAALMLGAASLVSRLVGLLRERVFTTTFGAGDTFDAFVAAFRMPDFVFNIVVIGALSAAFIPLFMDKLVQGERGKREAFTFALNILNTIVLIVTVCMALYALLAGLIVPWMTPGFSGEKLELTIQLSRIMALQPIFLAISFVFSGVLNSFKLFFAYGLAPIVYNIGIIFGVLVLVPRFGVVGLGWGVVVGAVLHMLVQFPGVWREGFRWRPVFAWASNDVKTLWRMLVPRVVGLAAQQINLLVVTIVGSTLLAGSITAFHLASNVAALPVGMFGLAFAQAAFPSLAEAASRRQQKEFADTFTRSLRYVLFFIIPIAIIFFLLRAQMIRVLFGDGAFDWEDTILTFETFGWLILSIFAQSIVPLLTRAFYVKQDTATPVVVSLVSIVVNIILAWVLAPRMGAPGLALAFSVAGIINLLLLWLAARRRFPALSLRALAGSVLKMIVAAVGAGAALQLLKYPVASVVDMHRFWGVLIQMLVAAAGGGGVYLGLCYLLQCEELSAIRRYLPRRFRLEGGIYEQNS